MRRPFAASQKPHDQHLRSGQEDGSLPNLAATAQLWGSADRALAIRQVIRFAFVGLCNTAVGYGIIFGCMYLGGLDPITSNVLGYGLGLLIAYKLHRNFTFGSTGTQRKEATRFLVVFGVAYSANLAVLYGLTHALHVPGGLSQVFSGAVYVVSSFLLSKCFVFTEVRPAAAQPNDG